MHVGNWMDVEGKAVTEAGAGGVTIRVLMGDNVGAPNFTTRHFEVAPGGHTPFHAHPWEHEVFVLSGKGKVKRKRRRNGRRAGELRLRPARRGARLRQRGGGDLLLPVRHPGDEGVPAIGRRPAERTASPPVDSAGCLADRTGRLRPLLLAVTLVLLLPLAGVAVIGKPLAAYLQFPPTTPDMPHAPFSLPVFLGLALLILAATAPLLLRLVSIRRVDDRRKPVMPFPWWGWAGAGLGAASWILAWSRIPGLGGFQAHAFTPLWIGFILFVNAFTARRTGRCLILTRTRPFLLLFPVSAGFWWSFEYLNRFVGNWRYVGGVDFGAAEYFLFATLPFSTVLPAVLSTRELLLTYPRFDRAFREWGPLSPAKAGGDRPRRAALLLRGAFRRRDRPRFRVPAGLARPAHAPDLPRRPPWRTAHPFRDRLRRLAHRGILRPRRPSLRLLLGNVEFRKLREVGVRHPLRRRPARLRDASPRVCRLPAVRGAVRRDRGPRRRLRPQGREYNSGFITGAIKSIPRRKPPFIPALQEGVR